MPINHKSTCRCPSDTEGDPSFACLVIGCKVHNDCPASRMCINGKCLDPCIYNNTCGNGANCRTIDHSLECSCPEGIAGNPKENCPTIHKKVCINDEDCASGLACLDNQCLNPCDELKPCRDSTQCSVVDSRPMRNMVCTCPDYTVPSSDGKCVNCKQSICLVWMII